jgi:hypothetical protein
MPRFDDDDTELGPPFPGKVKVAGYLWIAFGGLGLAVYGLGVLVSAALGAGGNKPGGSCGPVCGMLFCAAFIYVGYQTVSGTAKDTLGNSIGSLVFGLLYAAGAAVMVVTAAGAGPLAQPQGQRPANAEGLVIIAAVSAVVCAAFAAALIGAAAMALTGRSQYREWREANRPSARRRRRREFDDEPDDYDRPRRRRDDPDRGRPEDE